MYFVSNLLTRLKRYHDDIVKIMHHFHVKNVQVFKKEAGTVSDAERTRAKVVCLGIIYGERARSRRCPRVTCPALTAQRSSTCTLAFVSFRPAWRNGESCSVEDCDIHIIAYSFTFAKYDDAKSEPGAECSQAFLVYNAAPKCDHANMQV